MAKICIDAGHGGKDVGAVNGIRKESNDNLEMALKLQNLLTKQGIKVVMTRANDTNPTLAQRTSLANKEKCDLFLSLHRDSFPNANGATVYVYSKASQKTQDYGKAILDAVTGFFASRGVRKGAPNYKDFAVNRDTTMPACLLELGFISSALDNSTYDRKKDSIALAITKAICKQLGVTYKDVKPVVPITIKSGDVVKIAGNATYYDGKKTVPAWVKKKNWIVEQVKGDRAVIDKSQDGQNSINSPISIKFLTAINASKTAEFKPYLVKVTTTALNIRKGAGTNFGVTGVIRDQGVYTIVEESKGWGKLKSGAGWISLSYTKKVC